jgi:hypothetical protein
MIKHAIWHRILMPAGEREPVTLRELALELGVSRQYAEMVVSIRAVVVVSREVSTLSAGAIQGGTVNRQGGDFP